MNDVTNELLLEVLKQLQSDNTDMKKSLQDLKEGQITIHDNARRESLSNRTKKSLSF